MRPPEPEHTGLTQYIETHLLYISVTKHFGVFEMPLGTNLRISSPSRA